MSQTGRLSYLPLEKGSIRLLRVLPESKVDDIRCHLIHHKLDANHIPNFAALSYCWYDPAPVATIVVNGEDLGVAQNLLDFLQNRFLHGKHMLSHDSETLKNRDLWIDAICIDQTNDQEKSEQVQQMWKIYTMAPLVIAWLGKEKESTRKTFFALNTRHVGKTMKQDPPEVFERMIDEAKDDIVALTEDPYFTRIWIVPEVICAGSRMMLHCGRNVTYMEALYHFSGLSKGKIATQGDLRARTSDGLTLAAEGLLYTVKRTKEVIESALSNKMDTWMGINTLITCIMDNKTKECFDIRDKIFAFLGLPVARLFESESSPLLEVDYGMTLDEVVVATLSYIDRLGFIDKSGRSQQYAAFVVIGLFRVDIASEEFRDWVESGLERKEEDGTIKFMTGSGKKIDCATPFFEGLLGNGVSDLDKMLCGRFKNTDSSEAHKRFEEAKVRDRKKFSAFPLWDS